MKKFTKILIPILVLSLLVGLFAFVATANDEIEAPAFKDSGFITSISGAGEDPVKDTVTKKQSYVPYNAKSPTDKVEYTVVMDGNPTAYNVDSGTYVMLPTNKDKPAAAWNDETKSVDINYNYSVISVNISAANYWSEGYNVKFFNGKWNSALDVKTGETISQAFTGTMGTGTKYIDLGYDEDTPFTWHNLTMIVQYSTGVINFYIDGELYSSVDCYGDDRIAAGVSDARLHFPSINGSNIAVSEVTYYNYESLESLSVLFGENKANTLDKVQVELPYKTKADALPGPAAATIGDKTYSSLSAAVKEWDYGDTIELKMDAPGTFYFEDPITIKTNGYALDFDFDPDYFVAWLDGDLLTIEYTDESEHDFDTFTTVIFQLPDGTVLSKIEMVPEGSLIAKSYIPVAKETITTGYIGWVKGTDTTAELCAGTFLATDYDENETIYFTAVPKAYDVAAAVEDTKGAFTRYTKDELATFEARYKSVTPGYKYHILTDMTLTNVLYGGQGTTLVIHGVTVTWERSSGAARFFGQTQQTIEGVTVNGVRGKFVSKTADNIIYANDSNETSITLKNVDVEVVSMLTDMRRGTINLIDSTIVNTAGGYTIQLWGRYDNSICNLNMVNSKLSTLGVTYNNDGSIKGYIPALRLMGGSDTAVVNISIDTNSTIETTHQSNSNAFTYESANAIVSVYLGKNAVIKAGNGDFAFKNSNTALKLYLEEGYTSKTGSFQKVSEANVLLAGGGNGFWLKDGDNYVWTKAGKIVTVTFVVNGVATEVTLLNGATDITLPATNDRYAETADGWYKFVFSHWSTTEDGEEAIIDPTADGTYYAVYQIAEKATLVGYVEDADGNRVKDIFSPADFETEYKNATSGYKYHVVADITLTGSQYGGGRSTLVIHGVTVTWDAGDGADRFFKASTVVAIEGVTVEGNKAQFISNTKNNLYFSASNAGSLTIKNVDMQVITSTTDVRCGSINIIDTTLFCSVGHAVQIYNNTNSSVLNLTITNSTVSADGLNGTKYYGAIRVIHADGVTDGTINVRIDGNSKVITTNKDNSNALVIDNTVATTATLYIGKDVELKAGNGYFGLKNYNKNLVVTIEAGFKWTASAAPNFMNVANQNFKVADNANAYGYFKQVGEDFVWTVADKVVEITFDVNGTKTTIPLIDGNTEYTLPTVSQLFKLEGGKVIVSKFAYWSLTAGGEEVTIDPTVSATYYAVYADDEADWAAFDANNAIVAAGADVLPSSAVVGVAKIVLYNDVTLDMTAGVSFTTSVVFDLNGKVLTTYRDAANASGDSRFGLGNNSVTFQNGTLNSVHGANLIFAGNNTTGNITFTGLVFSASSCAIDFRSGGTLEVTGCTLNYNATSDRMFGLGIDGNDFTFKATNCVVNINDIDPEDNAASPHFFRISGRGETTTVKGTVVLNNVVIYGGEGNGFYVSDAAAPGSVVNITLMNGTKIFTKRSQVVGGGCANLTTKITVDETVVLDRIVLGKGMSFILPAGKVFAYQGEEGGRYAVVDFKAPTEVLGNLTLYTDINFNFFVPVTYGDTLTFAINGVEAGCTQTTINGAKYYRIAVTGIQVYEAANGEFVLTVTSMNGTAVEAELATCSVLGYAQLVLDNADLGVTSKTLVANVVDYIAAAYAYDTNGDKLPEALAKIMASESYIAATKEYNRGKIGASDANPEGTKGAIASVQLNVTTGFKYRLNLDQGYTGTLTVNGTEYVVEKGMCGENSYIEVKILACNMLKDNITVVDEANGINGSFDLEYYMSALTEKEEGKGDLSTLLEALYYYCEAAARYEALARP